MPYSDVREYRSMQLRVKRAENETEENKSYKVSGYFTTFNDPYELYRYDNVVVYEQVAENAFDDCDMSDVIMQYDHAGRVFARQSNKTLELWKDAAGYGMDANLGGTTIGRQLHEEIEGGYTTKMSWAFSIDKKKEEYTENEDGTVTVMITLLAIRKIYDVSAVSLPANPGTSIEATRSAYAAGVAEKYIQELKKKRAANKMRQELALKIKLALEE